MNSEIMIQDACPSSLPSTSTGEGPPAEAMKKYRELVFNLAKGMKIPRATIESVLDNAWRTRQDFEADCRVYKQRLEARRVLDEEVPRLRAKLAAAQERANEARPERLVGRLVTEFQTVGELVAALDQVRSMQDPNVITVSRERIALKDARTSLFSTEQGARRLLCRTADPSIDNRAAALSREMQGLKARIADRQGLVDLPERIERLRAEVKRLAAGEIAVGESIPAGGVQALYRQAKQRLTELLKMQSQRPAAMKEQERDEKEIVDLQRQLKELHQDKLVPENMRWAD